MLGYSVGTLRGASGTGKFAETFTFLTGLWSRPVRMLAKDDAVPNEVSE